MGSDQQKGKTSVSHGKEMFEREMKKDRDGQKAKFWQEMELKTGRGTCKKGERLNIPEGEQRLQKVVNEYIIVEMGKNPVYLNSANSQW